MAAPHTMPQRSLHTCSLSRSSSSALAGSVGWLKISNFMQVAINWTLCKGALPIPGAKNARQVKEAAGALGWRMSPDEVKAPLLRLEPYSFGSSLNLLQTLCL